MYCHCGNKSEQKLCRIWFWGPESKTAVSSDSLGLVDGACWGKAMDCRVPFEGNEAFPRPQKEHSAIPQIKEPTLEYRSSLRII